MRISDWSSDVCSSDLPTYFSIDPLARSQRRCARGRTQIAMSRIAPVSGTGGARRMDVATYTLSNPGETQMNRANERRQAITLRANRNKLAMAIVGLLVLGVSSGAHAATVECTDTAGNPAGTAGSNAVACGDEAVAGGWAVAIGRRAVAGDEAVAIGQAARAAGLASVSIGEGASRSEEHTSELQSLLRISYAVFCLKKKKTI